MTAETNPAEVEADPELAELAELDLEAVELDLPEDFLVRNVYAPQRVREAQSVAQLRLNAAANKALNPARHKELVTALNTCLTAIALIDKRWPTARTVARDLLAEAEKKE